jgi:hypothetical protein
MSEHERRHDNEEPQEPVSEPSEDSPAADDVPCEEPQPEEERPADATEYESTDVGAEEKATGEDS